MVHKNSSSSSSNVVKTGSFNGKRGYAGIQTPVRQCTIYTSTLSNVGNATFYAFIIKPERDDCRAVSFGK